MAEHKIIVVLNLLILFLQLHFPLTFSVTHCPLDLSGSNFTAAATLCSNKEDREKCCRYINALVAVSIVRYANNTGNLGVTPDLSQACFTSISETLEFYGVNRNATIFCGLGTKIPVTYECLGRTTVTQMLQSPRFTNVSGNCKPPLSGVTDCKRCLSEGILYLRNLIGATSDNMILSTCRDATFVALASHVDNVSTIDIASCFFMVQGLMIPSEKPPALLSPKSSPSADIAASPTLLFLGSPLIRNHRAYRLSLIPGLALVVTVVAILMLIVLGFMIRKKARELEDSDSIGNGPSKISAPPSRRFLEGPSSMFQKFSYKEMKKATDNFNTVIGQGGFGTVYKAQLRDGLVAAVKRMNKVSEQAEDEFCREIELVAKLHHRHLVALRGFCLGKRERFLVYEYMANRSLNDHLHTPGRPPLSWRTRIQIAIVVANALEYLHFYCDPPLCHRDIKSSNILLDDNFVAKVADCGLVHASKDGSICFETVNTDIRGTPGYMDPEYAVTKELTEKSDVYSYGVVLLELVTSRKAVQDNKNLVEWAQIFMNSDSKVVEIVDPTLGNSFNFDQLQTIVTIVSWCAKGESRARLSIKQVLRLLYECSDPMHSGFIEAVEDEEYDRNEGRGRRSRGKSDRGEMNFHSGDGRCLASSSSTSRSYCSRSFLLEPGSLQSPSAIPSI